ncbi:MAG: hypothetical protein EBQ96_07160 [Proteobacteria bacterium]|nr:hypothetical protein [Pseudomonadota bacterium]
MICGYSSSRNWARKSSGQRGVSLLLALIFVAFFGGILVAIAAFNNSRVRVAEAEVSGWELVEIAKAARIYVRDQLVANPALRTVAATPTRIPLTTLKAGGYLPTTFGRSVGALDYNALNQEIYVIMANWSATGLGGVVTDPATVPSAFVFFRPGGKSTFNLVVNVVESARRNGAVLTAPLFDTTGTNRSAICRSSGAAAGLWDTGCLTQAEFSALMTPLGLPAAFTAGGLIMPAWKAIQPDLRAVMRFPQPENAGYATMLTDIEMGIPVVQDCPNAVVGQQIAVQTVDASGNPVTTFTGLCEVRSDTAALNQRFHIQDVANIVAERIIAEPQNMDFGGTDAFTAGLASGNDQSFDISSNLTLNNDLRVFNNRPLNGITHRFSIPAATLAVERNSYMYSQDTSFKGVATITGDATANALITDSMTSGTLRSRTNGTTTGAPRISITSTGTMTGDTSVNGTPTAELISETIRADFSAGTRVGATFRATNNAGQVQVTNSLNLSGQTLSMTGTSSSAAVDQPSGYRAIIANINDANDVAVTGVTGSAPTVQDLSFPSNTSSLSGDTTRNTIDTAAIPTVAVTNGAGTSECLEGALIADACPNRQYFMPFITP